MKLYTNNLIESAFQFIAFYVGSETEIADIYNSAVLLMDAQLLNGYPPRTDIYMSDLNLWGKYVAGNLSQLQSLEITIEDESLTRIRNIKNSLCDLDEDIYYHLNEQEIFDYATHMFFDNFLQFLDCGKSSIKFPSPLEVLNRKTLEPIVKEVLKNKSKIAFMPNDNENMSAAAIGLRK